MRDRIDGRTAVLLVATVFSVDVMGRLFRRRSVM
jgi:hypothetical protein